ncbi:hypothetical protein GCM10009609_60400 [Pseudonocardia aurantiaca]|uniref:YaaC family protein n=1 Tax=Pseudonocardia aurantiaca TaxID=75290 RepID=A0ABW4FE64_9PSEU
MLLYYGLNQAGRALVAAAAEPDEKWEVSGHGIKCPNLDEVAELGDLVVKDAGRRNDDRSSFLTLATYAGSPSLPDGSTLREVWMSLPEGANSPLSGSRQLPSVVEISPVGRIPNFPNDEVSGFELYGQFNWLNADKGLSFDERAALLNRTFPTLHNSFTPRPMSLSGDLFQLMLDVPTPKGWLLVDLRNKPALPAWLLMTFGHIIYGDRKYRRTYATPTLGKNTKPLDPIISWWAVLFALSMLARYRPSAWSAMLDVDRSSDATAIEHLMRRAHKVCANIIVWHLQEFDLNAHGP